ncbi:MAG: hypothetical protein WAZ27_01820 [Minisyncoccia bacterium]
MPHFQVTPLGRAGRLADLLAFPVMQVLAAPGDSPQLTHFWNNTRMNRDAVDHLDADMMARYDGDPQARERRVRAHVRFHLGGWRQFVIVQSKVTCTWYVGWRSASGAGVSRIPVSSCVRMLIGPEEVEFFGVLNHSGEQIPIEIVGTGTLGDGTFTYIPLH